MKTDYLDNLAKARELKTEITPLTALFLIMEYSYEEMLTDIKKIDSDKIMSRLNVRVRQAYDMLEKQSQYILMRESQLSSDSFEQTFCDFNTVLEITGQSRAKVETLIRKGKIKAIQDKPGEKRRFDKSEILRYREGSK